MSKSRRRRTFFQKTTPGLQIKQPERMTSPRLQAFGLGNQVVIPPKTSIAFPAKSL
jgi:hypothetical protein